jgi:hypothetical protein
VNHSVYTILTIKYDARTPFVPGEIYYFHVTLLTDSRRCVSAISSVRSLRRRHATLVCDIRFSDNNTSIYRIRKYQIPTDANRGRQYTWIRDFFLYLLWNKPQCVACADVFSPCFPRVFPEPLRILHGYYISSHGFHLLFIFFFFTAFVNFYFWFVILNGWWRHWDSSIIMDDRSSV